MGVRSSDSRRERGQALSLSRAKAFRHITGDKYFVPAQSSLGSGYVVDVNEGTCSCPDFETRGGVCKHQWAVRYLRQGASDERAVVTETSRITYPQQWPAYNRAQCEEKDTVQLLLRSLCDGIEAPAQGMGRPRLPLRDAIYGATMKVYGTMSGRRSTSDLRASGAAGFLGHVPAYNTLFKYLGQPEMLTILKQLVDESAKPLVAIERNFAVDGTGFTTQTYVRWFDHAHGSDRRAQRWVKCHAMIGTLTNIVTAVEVTEGSANDSPQFVGLVQRTATNGFQVKEVSADKAYLGHVNLAAVEAVGGMPFIPLKSNSGSGGSPAWERLFHYYSANREEFFTHYHRRSNVESTFSAIKRKFGPGVRSRLQTAQFNEVLLKCLCHNLSMLVHSIHELGIDPKFWLPPQQGRA